MVPESRETIICDQVLRFLGAHRGPASEVSQPDRDKAKAAKQPPSVERVWRCRDGLVVVEHTFIESFPNQLASGAALTRLLIPVQKALETQLPRPGRYHLGIDEGALEGVPRREYPAMQRSIVAWAVSEAQRLVEKPVEDEEMNSVREATGRPPGVPFTVTLEREARGNRAVVLVEALKPDLEPRRGRRIETALRRKAPKLEAAKRAVGAVASLLILEVDDFQNSSVFLVNAAFKSAVLAVRADGLVVPEWVYLVQTDGAPFSLWILKGDGVPVKVGPHELQPAGN